MQDDQGGRQAEEEKSREDVVVEVRDELSTVNLVASCFRQLSGRLISVDHLSLFFFELTKEALGACHFASSRETPYKSECQPKEE